MELELNEVLFLGIWSLIGAILGYFTFIYAPTKAPIDAFRRCTLSVALGIFLAFPVYVYLKDSTTFSKTLDIMIAGLCAFGFPDFVMKNWATAIQKIFDVLMDKVITKRTRGEDD